MTVRNYEELKKHIGHKIICVSYGTPVKPLPEHEQRKYLAKIAGKRQEPRNVAIECETCHEVLLEFDRPEKK